MKRAGISKGTYPQTPTLDKMKSVHEKSQAIGEFLDLFLNHKKGIYLCSFRAAGNSGAPPYLWKKGVKLAKVDKAFTSSRPPTWRDVWNGDAEHNPDFEAWADGYEPVGISIEKLLAEYFKIDLNKAEEERCAILEYLRKGQ